MRGPESYRALYAYSPFRQAGRGSSGGGGGALTAYETAVLADSPSGYWKLGDSTAVAADNSGNARDGIYNGILDTDYTQGVADAFGGTEAMSLITTSGFINIPSTYWDAKVGAASTSYTFECLAKGHNIITNALVQKVTTGSNDYNRLMVQANDYIMVQIYDGATNAAVQTNYTLTDGNWRHLVMVRNAGDSTLKIYVDNNTPWNIAINNAVDASSTGDLQIGEKEASISHVAVYDTALSASQISTHFTASGL